MFGNTQITTSIHSVITIISLLITTYTTNIIHLLNTKQLNSIVCNHKTYLLLCNTFCFKLLYLINRHKMMKQLLNKLVKQKSKINRDIGKIY